jgi:hypothetical protein
MAMEDVNERGQNQSQNRNAGKQAAAHGKSRTETAFQLTSLARKGQSAASDGRQYTKVGLLEAEALNDKQQKILVVLSVGSSVKRKKDGASAQHDR